MLKTDTALIYKKLLPIIALALGLFTTTTIWLFSSGSTLAFWRFPAPRGLGTLGSFRLGTLLGLRRRRHRLGVRKALAPLRRESAFYKLTDLTQILALFA